MAEYFEREALIKKLRIMPIPKQAGSANTWLDNCAAGVNAAIREVASFPAADVAPVVRCKDCKSSCKDGNGRTCEGYWYELSEFAVPVKDDDFCSYGEPKMDGGVE